MLGPVTRPTDWNTTSKLGTSSWPGEKDHTIDHKPAHAVTRANSVVTRSRERSHLVTITYDSLVALPVAGMPVASLTCQVAVCRPPAGDRRGQSPAYMQTIVPDLKISQ